MVVPNGCRGSEQRSSCSYQGGNSTIQQNSEKKNPRKIRAKQRETNDALNVDQNVSVFTMEQFYFIKTGEVLRGKPRTYSSEIKLSRPSIEYLIIVKIEGDNNCKDGRTVGY